MSNASVTGLNLLPPEIAATIPRLYSNEESGAELMVHVRFHCPYSGASWLVCEFDGEDILFGWARIVAGGEELGYSSLKELSEIRIGGLLAIERDTTFVPKPLSLAIKREMERTDPGYDNEWTLIDKKRYEKIRAGAGTRTKSETFPEREPTGGFEVRAAILYKRGTEVTGRAWSFNRDTNEHIRTELQLTIVCTEGKTMVRKVNVNNWHEELWLIEKEMDTVDAFSSWMRFRAAVGRRA